MTKQRIHTRTSKKGKKFKAGSRPKWKKRVILDLPPSLYKRTQMFAKAFDLTFDQAVTVAMKNLSDYKNLPKRARAYLTLRNGFYIWDNLPLQTRRNILLKQKPKLFLGTEWDKRINEQNWYDYVFVSAAVGWSQTGGKYLKLYNFNYAKEIMLDCGGFSFFHKYSDFPYTMDEYIQWIKAMDKLNDNKVESVATMDYPCEPSINRKAFNTNKERIHATIRNTKKLLKMAPEIPWMPVIQGFVPREYEYCIKEYIRDGINRPYMAVGSLCKRRSVKQIEDVIRAIRKHYSGKLHFFGLNMLALKSHYVKREMYSTDTISYTYGARNFEEKMINREKIINNFKRANC